MILANYHTHTTFCDGKSTPQEIVEKAIENKMSVIGFSGHGYTGFDKTYCMTDTDGYVKEVLRLKKLYSDRIDILLGVESDAHDPIERGIFDYVIGSSHYVEKDGSYYPVDSSPEHFDRCMELFGGDAVLFAESYYSHFCEYVKKYNPDIVGHFDLVTKFDEDGRYGFLNNPRYHSVSEYYFDKILDTGALIELNTGAISRGYRTTPYPYVNLLRLLKRRGGRLILNSDSHHKDTLIFGFDKAAELLREVGIHKLYALTSSGLSEYEL